MDEFTKISIKYLMDKEKCFFGGLLMQIIKKETKEIDTAGVNIINGQLYLYYNQDFITAITKTEGIQKVKGIIEHELLHLVFDHISRSQLFNREKRIYNIACDMAINQLIKKELLPDFKQQYEYFKSRNPEVNKEELGIILPELFNLPNNKDAEYYYNALIKQGEGGNGQGEGQNNSDGNDQGDNQGDKPKDSFDSHDGWSKAGNKQIVDEVVKQAVKKAYDIAKQRGTIPGYLKEMIDELLAPPVVNWKHIFRQYVSNKIKTGNKTTWKRLNRRLPEYEQFKGKVSNRTIKLLVAIDTSGSIDTEDFNDFLNEIKGILNVYKCNIDLLQCDMTINKKEKLLPYTQPKMEFVGRGGTSFKPVFEEYNKDDSDLLIYFTDGYGDQEQMESRKNVIWVLTKKNSNHSFKSIGTVIQMN